MAAAWLHFCHAHPTHTHPPDTSPMLAPQGIGPATGSAILEAADPSIAFTSDEAMQAALNSKDYTGEQSRAEMAARQKASHKRSPLRRLGGG